MTYLLRYLIMNRAGTRPGRATWIYFAFCAVVLVTHNILVHRLHVFTVDQTELSAMMLITMAPLILLLNRRDHSGPTIEEAEAAKCLRAEARRAQDLAKRDSTFAFRFGRWLRKQRH